LPDRHWSVAQGKNSAVKPQRRRDVAPAVLVLQMSFFPSRVARIVNWKRTRNTYRDGSASPTCVLSAADSGLLAQIQLPQPHRIVQARAGQGAVIGGERERGDSAPVPSERGPLPARRQVPQLHSFVSAAAGQDLAVGRECQALDRALVPSEDGAF